MRLTLLLSLLALSGWVVCSPGYSYTMTFDEAGRDEVLGMYWNLYGAVFSGAFGVADHSHFPWGPPRSGNNVLIWDWHPGTTEGMLKFGFYQDGFQPYRIYSLSAYFSTQMGAVISIDGYTNGALEPTVSVLVGNPSEQWVNRYASIHSPEGAIDFVMFRSVSSVDALRQFSADDMTVVPVPEPSSLLALGAGVAGLVGLLRRRRC